MARTIWVWIGASITAARCRSNMAYTRRSFPLPCKRVIARHRKIQIRIACGSTSPWSMGWYGFSWWVHWGATSHRTRTSRDDENTEDPAGGCNTSTHGQLEAAQRNSNTPNGDVGKASTRLGVSLNPWLSIGRMQSPTRVLQGLEQAKLRRVRFHDLRHTYASLLIQTTAPAKYIQEQLGHASIQMTINVYGHLYIVGNTGTSWVVLMMGRRQRSPHPRRTLRPLWLEQARQVIEMWSRRPGLNGRPAVYEFPIAQPRTT